MKLSSWLLREDEGVGKEEGGPRVGNLWGTETQVVFSAVLCLGFPSLEPQHSSPEGRSGCRGGQTLSLLRKGGSCGSSLEAWCEGLAPCQALGRAAGPPGAGRGRQGRAVRAREAKGRKEAATLPKRLGGGGAGWCQVGKGGREPGHWGAATACQGLRLPGSSPPGGASS